MRVQNCRNSQATTTLILNESPLHIYQNCWLEKEHISSFVYILALQTTVPINILLKSILKIHISHKSSQMSPVYIKLAIVANLTSYSYSNIPQNMFGRKMIFQHVNRHYKSSHYPSKIGKDKGLL